MWTVGSGQDFFVSAIEFYWFSLRFLNSLGSQIQARGFEKCCRHYIHPAADWIFWTVTKSLVKTKRVKIKVNKSQKLTAGSLWKITTRPPLSPVANKSPSWLNSTQDMMSAKKYQKKVNFALKSPRPCQLWRLNAVVFWTYLPLHRRLMFLLLAKSTIECHLSLEKSFWNWKFAFKVGPLWAAKVGLSKALRALLRTLQAPLTGHFAGERLLSLGPLMILEIFMDSVKAVKRNGLKRTMKQIFVKYFIPVLYTQKTKKRFQKTPNILAFPSKQKIILVTMRTAVAADSAWAALSTRQSLPPFTNGAKVIVS